MTRAVTGWLESSIAHAAAALDGATLRGGSSAGAAGTSDGGGGGGGGSAGGSDCERECAHVDCAMNGGERVDWVLQESQIEAIAEGIAAGAPAEYLSAMQAPITHPSTRTAMTRRKHEPCITDATARRHTRRTLIRRTSPRS